MDNSIIAPSMTCEQAHPLVPLSAARLPAFVAGPADAPERLHRLRVVLIGVGSIGRGMLGDLCRLGIDSMQLVDPGRFKEASYLTHPSLCPGEALGDSKARNAAELARAMSPQTDVTYHAIPVESLPLMAMANADVAILATDNIRAEVETGQRCLRLGIPLIQASVDGSTLLAQVRFFGNRASDASNPCPACGLSNEEWRMLDLESRFSCEPIIAPEAVPAAQTRPTISVSFLCAIAANLALTQLLKWVLKLGPTPENTLLEYCGYTHRTIISPLRRRASCPCDHGMCQRVRINGLGLSQRTLSELFRAADSRALRTIESVQLGDDLHFCETTFCRCGKVADLHRFFASHHAALGTCSCGADLRPAAFYSHRAVPADRLTRHLEVPLAQLGAENVKWAMLRAGESRFLMYGESAVDEIGVSRSCN